MKKIYLFFIVLYGIFSNAQIVNIPDANFKARLLAANYDNLIAGDLNGNYIKIDANNDNEIDIYEAENIKILNISEASISDITGISAFYNLEQLNCSRNNLTSIDVSSLNNLLVLYCYNNQLTTLNIDNCNLYQLDCSNNLLSNIDISTNLNLNQLYCYNNNLTTLNVSQNVDLENFNCSDNVLTNLDIGNNIYLINLYCDNNLISSLNISQNTYLNELSCKDNQLTELITSENNIVLSSIYCDGNQFVELDFSNLGSLGILYCNNNSNLNYINLKNNLINQYLDLEIGNNPSLEYICADDFEISEIELTLSDYGYSSTCHVNSYCSFNPGGTFYEISGNIKLDFDNNGCDLSDLNLSNLRFNITDGSNSGSFIANSTGNYYIPVQAGIHTITPNLENTTYFTISPISFVVDFPTDASPFSQDFCVTANGVHSDVEVIVMPTTPARPGFDAHYRIIFKNIGNQVENGEVTFKYFDDKTDYVSSSVVFDSQTYYGTESTLHWNYTNLMPFETRTIDVVLNVNSPMETPAVNIGDVLGIFSEISTTNTDEDLSNNSSGLRQVVVGSYDPNDKTCLEGDTVDITTVGKYVHYVIRFENTGTYPAQNIVVKDMIDISKFDVSTLVPLHGSHEFYTRIKDNKVEFIFENINLDFNDATNDGYVAFKIKTLPSLTVGDTFSNDANIYFDYNFLITTNEYETTIQNLLSSQDFAFENEFVLYPNPAKHILNISTKNQTEIQSVEIYNIVGQVVIAIPNTTNTIDVSSLEAGTYFVKVNTEKGSSTTKFVKE